MNKLKGYVLVIMLGVFICFLSFSKDIEQPEDKQYTIEITGTTTRDALTVMDVEIVITSNTVYFEWDSSDREIVRKGMVKQIKYSNMSGGITYSTDVYVVKMLDGSYTTETEWEGIWEDIQPEELYFIEWYEEEDE